MSASAPIAAAKPVRCRAAASDAMGLGCAKTSGGALALRLLGRCEFGVGLVFGAERTACRHYALIAATSGGMPTMFMTRVKL